MVPVLYKLRDDFAVTNILVEMAVYFQKGIPAFTKTLGG
jgi:hypothetical protein